MNYDDVQSYWGAKDAESARRAREGVKLKDIRVEIDGMSLSMPEMDTLRAAVAAMLTLMTEDTAKQHLNKIHKALTLGYEGVYGRL